MNTFSRRQRQQKTTAIARSYLSNHGAPMPSHPTVECGICGQAVEKVVPLDGKFVCLSCKEKPQTALEAHKEREE